MYIITIYPKYYYSTCDQYKYYLYRLSHSMLICSLDRVSCSLDWFRTQYVAKKNDLELLMLTSSGITGTRQGSPLSVCFAFTASLKSQWLFQVPCNRTRFEACIVQHPWSSPPPSLLPLSNADRHMGKIKSDSCNQPNILKTCPSFTAMFNYCENSLNIYCTMAPFSKPWEIS